MGFKLEFNTILSLPGDQDHLASELQTGNTYTVIKSGERIFPVNIPIDLSDSSYKFVAKVVVRKLTISTGKTELTIEVVKLFDDIESKVISDNFSKHA